MVLTKELQIDTCRPGETYIPHWVLCVQTHLIATFAVLISGFFHSCEQKSLAEVHSSLTKLRRPKQFAGFPSKQAGVRLNTFSVWKLLMAESAYYSLAYRCHC